VRGSAGEAVVSVGVPPSVAIEPGASAEPTESGGVKYIFSSRRAA